MRIGDLKPIKIRRRYGKQIAVFLLVLSAARTCKRSIQACAALTYPAYAACRDSRHKRIVLYVFCYYGARGDERAPAYRMPADHGGVGSQRSTLFNQGLGIYTVYGEMRPWSNDVGKHAGRAAEYVVLQLHAFVNRHVVLDAHAVAHFYVIRYVHVLPQRTVLSDNRSLLNMREMPDFSSFSHRCTLVYIAAGVNETVILVVHCFL